MDDDDDGQQRRSVNPTLFLSAGAPPPPPFPPAATVAPATAVAANDDKGEALPAAVVAAAAPMSTAFPLDVLQVGEVWRRGLQGLAQSLKCPICLGYVFIRRSSLLHSHPSMPLSSIVCVLIMVDALVTSVCKKCLQLFLIFIPPSSPLPTLLPTLASTFFQQTYPRSCGLPLLPLSLQSLLGPAHPILGSTTRLPDL